jgi:hypothetical protein
MTNNVQAEKENKEEKKKAKVRLDESYHDDDNKKRKKRNRLLEVSKYNHLNCTKGLVRCYVKPCC